MLEINWGKRCSELIKYSFKNDYSEIAHPDILSAFTDIGNTQFEAYGLDVYSKEAIELIRTKIGKPCADVHFISGGTQANLTVIGSILKPHEATIAADTGHIFTNECGAIEATGHKVCITKGENGKILPAEIEKLVTKHSHEHVVKIKLVYISQTTELGSVYTKSELLAIKEVCEKLNLYLFIDGARLGSAVNSKNADFTFADIADIADAFYIGGTKNGALFGEAIVITNDDLKTDFRYHLKQRGAMLAKGAVIGLQFRALFENNLFDELAKHANAMTARLADGIEKLGFSFASPVESNQAFPVFPNALIEKLQELYEFHVIIKNITSETSVCRFCTSWATTESTVDEFLRDLEALI